MKKDGILYTVAFVALVSFAFVFLLSLANVATKDEVARNRLAAERKSILNAFGIGYGSDAEALAAFDARVERLAAKVNGVERPLYRATVDGLSLYALKESGAGLWGTIELVVAAPEDRSRVAGVEVVAQHAPPGLGGRIDEAWFKEQWRDELVPPGGIGIKTGAEASGKADADKGNGSVEGVSGASRSSQSFAAIVAKGLASLKQAIGGAR